MHSESEIRKAIRPLLDKYGELNTSEVKEKLEEVLIYDEEDKEPSPTRSEIKILQRIGNIVAHQKSNVKTYAEGFVVDKTPTPAKFIALIGTGSTKAPLSKTQISERKKKESEFKAKKTDWGKKRERNEEVGNLGEEFVCEYEKDRVSSFDPSSVDRVLHLSRLQGDGLGYDISSVNSDGSIRRIEVKTTKCGLDTPFYMSKNEEHFFKTYKNDGAYVYRVYDFSELTRRGKVEIISAEDLLNNYKFEPVTFAVTKK